MTAKKTDTIRTFVAVELSDSIKAHIAADIAQIRQEQIDNMRLVRPEGVHLTLKFLGDIDANRVPTVAEAMTQAAARHPPFSLALGQPGVFPNANRPRVLWIGVEGDLQPLRLLQSDIEEALVAAGFPPEKQRFNPHLTVGRMHHRASREDRRRATDALAALTLPEDRTISVKAISLMKSTLLPGGAIYDQIVHTELSYGRV